MKFVIIIVAILAVVWFMILRPNLKSNSKKSHKTLASETMQECCVCGLFVSEKEGLKQNNQFFCSQNCLLESKQR